MVNRKTPALWNAFVPGAAAGDFAEYDRLTHRTYFAEPTDQKIVGIGGVIDLTDGGEGQEQY